MKKDIEWLKEEIGDLPIADTIFIIDGVSYIDSAVSVMSVYDLIDQLDEPGVLSQEWIYSYSINASSNGVTEEYVHVDDLKNLMVPKHAITFDEVHDKLREESILSEKSFDYYWNCINDNVEIDEPGNLIIPKQTLPVIPKYVANFIEARKHAFISLQHVFHRAMENRESELFEEEHDWVRNNSETFAKAWLDGYTVEEEQKYYVDLDTAAYVAKWKDDDRVDIYTDGISGSDGFEFHLTEQEIKNYDERFWPFAKPVE